MRLLLLIAACVACDTNEVVEVGVIELGRQPTQPVRIENPTTARVGHSFDVRIVTYGNGCVSAEDTVIEALSDEAFDITPLDRRRTSGNCTSKLCTFPHEATIVFDTPGTKTLRFTGRRVDSVPAQPEDGEEYIEVWRQVVVE